MVRALRVGRGTSCHERNHLPLLQVHRLSVRDQATIAFRFVGMLEAQGAVRKQQGGGSGGLSENVCISSGDMTEVKRLKPKKCKVCRESFEPFRPLQVCCSAGCAIEHAQNARAKVERKELKQAKEKAKTRGQWMNEAQAAVNAYCRLRDLQAGHRCICCGKPFEPQRPGGSVDAGHYLGRGAYPELRFEEKNIHAQRKSCNRPGGTTAASFRRGMIERVGIEVVEWLEGKHDPKHYSIEDLKGIKETYNRKARELMKGAVK